MRKAPLFMVGGALVGVAACLSVGFALAPSTDSPSATPTPSPTHSTLVETVSPGVDVLPLPDPSPSATIAPNGCEERALVTAEDGSCVDPGFWDDMPDEPREPWVQPCTDWIADHGGICKGEPIEWGFSSGDTLVCGHDAKPAIDYREDVGFWAYCEPALIGGS